MSLSPFDSFQSRFVTYLLNRPRNTKQFYFYCHLECCYFILSEMHYAWRWSCRSVSLYWFACCGYTTFGNLHD